MHHSVTDTPRIESGHSGDRDLQGMVVRGSRNQNGRGHIVLLDSEFGFRAAKSLRKAFQQNARTIDRKDGKFQRRTTAIDNNDAVWARAR